tara:strand:- start:33 stop:188 length:156 start_codon:yes stop_codon:yes gene_type:complete
MPQSERPTVTAQRVLTQHLSIEEDDRQANPQWFDDSEGEVSWLAVSQYLDA